MKLIKFYIFATINLYKSFFCSLSNYSKRVVLIFFVLLSAIVSSQAQDISRAAGLRFGGIDESYAELSYQQPLWGAYRAEANVGISLWGTSFSALFQKVWDLSALGNGFNWYAGGGLLLGEQNLGRYDKAFGMGILGQAGIEYNFNIPLQFSLEYRPLLYFITEGDQLNLDGLILSVRYRF